MIWLDQWVAKTLQKERNPPIWRTSLYPPNVVSVKEGGSLKHIYVVSSKSTSVVCNSKAHFGSVDVFVAPLSTWYSTWEKNLKQTSDSTKGEYIGRTQQVEFFLGFVPEDTENNGAKDTTQGCYNPYDQSSYCQSQFQRSHYLQPVGVYGQTWKDYNSRYSITRSAKKLF